MGYVIYLAIMAVAMYPGRKGVRNRLDPLDWLSAAVTCNGDVICKPLFTVELTDGQLPDICYRMKLIQSSRESERPDGIVTGCAVRCAGTVRCGAT